MAEFFGVIGDLVKSGLVLKARDYSGSQAETYDLNQAWTGDVQYYVDWAVRQGGPVLELACGTGRVALNIARAGVQVVGLDLSREMLDVFQRKLQTEPAVVQQRVKLVRADMTEFGLAATFPLVLVPCYSFSHLTMPQQRAALFKCAWRHLQDRGILVMEMPLWVEGEEWTGNQPRYRHHRRQGEDLALSYYQTRPEEPGLVTLNFLSVYFQGGGRARVEAVACSEYRATPVELEAMAGSAGFREVNLYRDYRGNPLQRGSHSAVMVARK